MSFLNVIPWLLMDCLFPILPQPGQLLKWTLGTAGMILAVLALRWLLNGRISCRLRYALWALVLVRALLPFQMPVSAPVTTASLVPDTPSQWEQRSVPVYRSGADAFEDAHEYYQQLEPGYLGAGPWSSGYVERSEDGGTLTYYLDMYSPTQIVQCVYLAGVVLTAGAILVSNLRFRRRLCRTRREVSRGDSPIPVYLAEGLPSPCLYGILRPAVYLTPEAEADGALRRHVLTHELTHYAHKDHLWAVLRCACLTLHWFNPLVWAAVWLSKRDCELACDEGVVQRLGEEERFAYGRTLVDMVARNGRTDLLSCSTTMTEGKKSIQQRVELLVQHPETKKTALFLAVSLLVLAAVFTFANEQQEIRPGDGSYDSESGYELFLDLLNNDLPLSIQRPVLRSDTELPYITDEALSHAAKQLLLDQHEPLQQEMEDQYYHELMGSLYNLYLYYQYDDQWYRAMNFCIGKVDGQGYIFLRVNQSTDALIPVAVLDMRRVTDLIEIAEQQQESNDHLWQTSALGYADLQEGVTSAQAIAIHDDARGMFTNFSNEPYGQLCQQLLDLIGQSAPVSQPMADLEAVSGWRIQLYDETAAMGSCPWSIRTYYLHLEDGLCYLTIQHDGTLYAPIATLPAGEAEALVQAFDKLWRESDPDVPDEPTTQTEYDAFLTALDGLFLVKLTRSPLASEAPYTAIQDGADLESARKVLREQTAVLSTGDPVSRVSFPNKTTVHLDTDPLAATAYEYDVTATVEGGYVLFRIDRDEYIPVAALSDAGVEALALLAEPVGLTQVSIGVSLVGISDRYTIDDPGLVTQLSGLLLNDPETVEQNRDPNYDLTDWLTNQTAVYIISYGTPPWSGDTVQRWYARAVTEDRNSFYGLELPEALVDDVLALCVSPIDLLADTPIYPADAQAAANAFGEKLAETYRTLDPAHPNAVTDAQFFTAEVYDQSETVFCANITLAVAPLEPNTVHWMAGAGIDPMDGAYAGYWELTREYKFVKGADHFWHCAETATGGLRAD